MFQSVTYTGFEKHPDRRAWVEGVVMPLMEEAVRREETPIRVHWHDPDLPGATVQQLEEIVRKDILPSVDVVPPYLDGSEGVSGLVAPPSIILILASDALPTGWTFLPVPGNKGSYDLNRIQWAIQSIYISILRTVVREVVETLKADLVLAEA